MADCHINIIYNIFYNKLKTDGYNIDMFVKSLKKLRMIHTNKMFPIKVIKLNSTTGSDTAKNGYKEEVLVANDLNTINTLLYGLKSDSHKPIGGPFKKIKGNSKTDVTDNYHNCQVKKYKKKQFGQVDRHDLPYFVKKIPFNNDEINIIIPHLQGMIQYPLQSCQKLCDKTLPLKLLTTSNYEQSQLDMIVNILNKYKLEILEYAFYGYDKETQPIYLIGVEYDNKIRKKITILKMIDVINYLSKYDFVIHKKGSVIGLNNTFTLQRKGGDSGNKSGNDLQIKLVFSRLNIDPLLEYHI